MSQHSFEHRSRPRHRLFGPLAGLAAGALGLIVLVSIFLIHRFDESATIREEHTVDNGFALVINDLDKVVATQAEWDSAVKALDRDFDPEWADFNVGNYLYTFNGFSHSYILDRDGRVIVDNHSSFSLYLSRDNLREDHLDTICKALDIDRADLDDEIAGFVQTWCHHFGVIPRTLTVVDVVYHDPEAKP